MSLVLNTNIDSLVAQNALTSSGSQLATALQQLSSGLRINTAADDAAGYAISQGITSQINGMNQAEQNANDGVSLAQTGSGAMQGIVNDLQSMRDLAVESLNASNGANDRADLNAQFQQLMNDINNVSSQTQFNGVNLLDGSFQGATFQVGANAGQSITMASIASTSSSAIGNYFSGVTSVSGSVKTADGTTVNTTAGTAGSYSPSTLKSTSGLNTASLSGYSVNLDVAVNGGTAVQTGPITLTGTASTDLRSIAAAVNQALSSSGGLVATVNSNDSGITISGTSASGTGSVVNFSIGSATDSAGNSVTPGAATLGALGVDSSDVVGYYTPSLAAGATTPATPGTYSAANITTDLTGIRGLSATNPGSVTLTVNDGTNTFTTGAISITGNAATDLANIASALNDASDGANTFSTTDNISFAANGGDTGLAISGSNTGTVALTFGLSSPTTGNTGAAATPTLTALGVDASDSVAANGVATPTTPGSYSASTLHTDLSGSVAPSATNKASVVLGISLNGGTVIDTGSINLDAVQADDTGAIVSALNTALSGSGFTASAGANGVTIAGSGGSNALATFSMVSAKDAAGNTVGSPNGNLLGSLGVDGSDSYAAGAAGTQTTSSSAQYLSGLNVNTVDNSNLVLISVDNALQQIATASADLGAYQNRFQAAITNLTTDATNLTSAQSAITDTDYAAATSNLSKAQILQQAGTAMVAQANTIPQNILTLLQKLP
ncbi:MAG: flagellin [Steroidobacteraceae bacterium]